MIEKLKEWTWTISIIYLFIALSFSPIIMIYNYLLLGALSVNPAFYARFLPASFIAMTVIYFSMVLAAIYFSNHKLRRRKYTIIKNVK